MFDVYLQLLLQTVQKQHISVALESECGTCN